MKPVPTKLKILRGNPGKRPINTEEPQPRSDEIPKMPSYLAAYPIAVEEWERESDILFRMGVLTEADVSLLATRCYIAHQLRELAEDIAEEGRVVNNIIVTKNGTTETSKSNPKCVQEKALLSEYRQIGASFGLDPSARTKLKTNNSASSKSSKIKSFKKKRA